jgi:hypothetical protein
MHTHTHTHRYIYNAQEEAKIKTWHGLSRNQGVAGEHDEQYQMSAGT